MADKKYRVVHYLNQFYAGIGGEEKANIPPLMKEGAVGPGIPLQQALGEEGEIVATVVCGDSYFAENIEAAAESVVGPVPLTSRTYLSLARPSMLVDTALPAGLRVQR